MIFMQLKKRVRGFINNPIGVFIEEYEIKNDPSSRTGRSLKNYE